MKRFYYLIVFLVVFNTCGLYAEDIFPGSDINDIPSGPFESEITARFEPDTDDLDNDGLKNAEEEKYGTDPYDPDSDNDGVTDLWEVTNGTNPNSKDTTGYLEVFDLETAQNIPGEFNETVPPIPGAENDFPSFPWDDANDLPEVTDENEPENTDENNEIVPPDSLNEEGLTFSRDNDDGISKDSLNELADEENNQQALLDSPSSGHDLIPILMLLLLGDNDNDGMDDDWEMRHFGTLANGADEDPDADNLSNLGEYNNHTDPNNPDTDDDGLTDGWEVVNGLNPNSIDSDEDLMPDNWEVTHSLNPIVFDSHDNLDNDGFTNCQEYKLETDPNNAGDTPTAPDDIDLGLDNDEQQGGGGLVGETIRILNGNVIESRTDLSFSSPNKLGLSLEAYYNSKSSYIGSMGYGWTHTYEVFLDDDVVLGSLTLLKITDSTGKSHYFYQEAEGEYKGIFAEKSYVKIESNNYIWHLLDGTQYGFSSAGRLLWIDDPSSNRLALTYDINNKLTKVTNSASGRELNFYYDVNGYLDYVTGPITTAVTDGKWVDYTITSQNLTSVTYKDNSGFNYTYTDTNDIHNLTGKANKAGHQINTWGYDTSDRATSNFSRDGKGVDLIAYQTSTLVNVTDAYSKIRTYSLTTKATRKRIETITETGGRPLPFPWSSDNTVNWVYDNNMNPVETETAGGTVTRYSNYDERGNPNTVTLAFEEPEEREITFTYHSFINAPLTRTEASVLGQPGGSKETIWDYDNDYDAEPNENPTANVSRVIEKGYTRDVSGTVVPYEYITTITYNSKGQVLTIDGPRLGATDTTSIIYNTTTGDIQSITRPLIGASTFSNYDNAGQAGTITDVNNQSKKYTYDARGRVITSTNNADSSASSVMYNTAGLPEVQTDEDAVDTTFDYEAAYGRLFKRFDHEGNYIQYSYDTQGNVTEKGYYDPTDTRSNRQRYLYQDPTHNMPGLLFKEINGDDTYTQYGYDLEGNVISVRNPNGDATSYLYDPLNRLKTVTQPGERVTTYGYDTQGNLTSVTDAETHVTTYLYDDMGRLVSTSSSDTGTVTYVYDEAGNPVYKKDAKEVTVGYQYDLLNRLTNVNFPDTTQNIVYSYDQGANGKGQRTGMTDESGTTLFTYNARGRLTGKTNIVNGVTYNLSRIYTPGGRVSSITYPTERTVDYHRSYCACSVDSITTTYNSITKTLMENLSYRPFGGAKGMETGGGGTVGSTFNNAGRMTVSNPGATHEKTYTYDNNGNLTSITAPSLPYNSRVYGYDALDRLTHAEGPWGNIDYTYDDVGNRQTETIGTNTQTYSYLTGTNRLNTITGGTAKTYAYDLNGNITGINTKTLTYNQDNRLTKVQEGSTVLGEYTYNGLGQRIKKVAGTTITIFHYDFDGNIIGESNISGAFSKEYLYRSSNRLAMVNTSTGDVYFFGNDSLGTPQILTNSTNSVVWEANYKPFGEAAVNQGSTVVNNFRFQGQYYDSETGLHYNYHRYYEPTTGRYLTPDPIGLGNGINVYSYVKNNPINYDDMLGLVDINLHDPVNDKDLYKPAKTYKSSSGYFTVGGHGTPSAIYDDRSGLKNSKALTPSGLVDIIVNDKNYKGQDIELVSCNTGKGTNPFAQQVADELNKRGYNVTVYGANDFVQYSYSDFLGKPWFLKMKVKNNGQFLPFKGRP